MDNWVAEAEDPLQAVIGRQQDRDAKVQKAQYKEDLTRAINLNDPVSIGTSIEQMHQIGMDDSDIRRYITDTYKPLYLAAYQKDSVEGEAEMGDIEEALMSTDLGYDYDSHFNKWIQDYENKLNEGD